MKNVWICMFVFIGSLSASAEMRLWTNKDGKPVRAEFVKELFDVVTLRTSDGKEFDIAVKQLSPADLTYVRTVVPPEVDVSFSKRTEPKERSSYAREDDEINIVTGEITITKERYPPFLGTLFAEVFLIGREVATPQVYVLLGRSREAFTLTREDEERHVFTFPVESRRFWEYNAQFRGNNFAGYVIIVADNSGRRIKVASNLSWMTEDKMEALCRLPAHSFFNESCQKVPVPRPDDYTTRSIW